MAPPYAERKPWKPCLNKPEPSHSSLRSDPVQVLRNACSSPAGMSAQVEWNPQLLGVSSIHVVATCGRPTSSNAMLAIANALAARGGKEVVKSGSIVIVGILTCGIVRFGIYVRVAVPTSPNTLPGSFPTSHSIALCSSCHIAHSTTSLGPSRPASIKQVSLPLVGLCAPTR